MKKVIILHGWTKNLDKWNAFLDALKEKGINADLSKIPGLTENLDKVWNLSDYVKWLKNIVDKEKNKVILIGHSNGGRIALAFTNLYPEKVGKLILIDSGGIYHNELPLRIKRTVFKTIAKIGKKLTSSRSMKNLLYKFARESDYKDLDENTKQTMINLISTDLKPMLSQIQIPTLIIWGREDKITPLSDGISMSNLIKNSKLEIIENAHHSPQFTNPKEVIDAVLGFYEYI
jgi:pimeloyl-ACP methyl ester carboxylesterase